MKSKTTAADSISTHGDAGWTLLLYRFQKRSRSGVLVCADINTFVTSFIHYTKREAAMDRRQHWENVYQTKSSTEVSWYEPDPKQSLDLILQVSGPSRGRVIDIGGGQSFLVDKLLDSGFSHIAVLDISQTAIEATKARLGNRALQVEWIV
ncbi:MAG: hypothetical protein MUC83_09665, partial [Pirellula sp.]|nr:hypothetical protein [Pirellula sp.]